MSYYAFLCVFMRRFCRKGRQSGATAAKKNPPKAARKAFGGGLNFRQIQARRQF
jgi:hypothetical protein